MSTHTLVGVIIGGAVLVALAVFLGKRRNKKGYRTWVADLATLTVAGVIIALLIGHGHYGTTVNAVLHDAKTAWATTIFANGGAAEPVVVSTVKTVPTIPLINEDAVSFVSITKMMPSVALPQPALKLESKPYHPTAKPKLEKVAVTYKVRKAEVMRTVVTHAHHSGVFRWKHFGADPFAESKDEAMEKRRKAFVAMRLSETCVVEAMRVTSAPGTPDILQTGDRLLSMESGREGIRFNVEVSFPRGIQATTEEWHLTCEGKSYELILPAVCYNWSLANPHEGIPKPAIAQCAGYKIPLDYRHTPLVKWTPQHAARVSVHLKMTEDQLEAMNRNPCFGVYDADGFRKPFHRCDTCDDGQWPPVDLAHAVGLPSEPPGRFAFYLAGGVGYLSLPRSVAIERLMVFCVNTHLYTVAVSGYMDWRAETRFDVVYPSEIRKTLSKGKLDRTLVGTKSYAP